MAARRSILIVVMVAVAALVVRAAPAHADVLRAGDRAPELDGEAPVKTAAPARPPATELQSPPARHARTKDPDDDRSGEVLPPEHVAPAPPVPPTSPDDAPPFERGFVIDLDGGVGATAHGGVLSGAIFPGYAVTPAVAIGARFAVAAAKTDQPGAAQLAFAALAGTYEYRRVVASAGVGAGVVDQHGGFAWDLRAGYDAHHWGVNHLVVGLAVTDVGGKEGVALFEFVVGLHHR